MGDALIFRFTVYHKTLKTVDNTQSYQDNPVQLMPFMDLGVGTDSVLKHSIETYLSTEAGQESMTPIQDLFVHCPLWTYIQPAGVYVVILQG